MANHDSHIFKSIQQPTVVDQIIQMIKMALINGELAPGHKLPSEPDMAQQMGVSRSAVREALKVLQAIGVVVSRQGSGTYIVDQPSERLLDPLAFTIILGTDFSSDLIELRVMIQIGYCELAAGQADDDDWKEIERAVVALEEAFSNKLDHNKLAKLDLDFHYAILDATHNPLVRKIGRTVEELFLTSIRENFRTEAHVQQAIQAHRNILQALKNKDLLEIRTAIVDSLNNTPWKDQVKTFRRLHINGHH